MGRVNHTRWGSARRAQRRAQDSEGRCWAVSTHTTTDKPGTVLPFTTLPTGMVCRGIGVYWATEVALVARPRRIADRAGVLGVHAAPVRVDLSSVNQPPIQVPRPPRERNP